METWGGLKFRNTIITQVRVTFRLSQAMLWVV